MAYKYIAYAGDRRIVEGMINVSSETLAKEALWQSGYNVVSLKATKPRLSIRQSLPTFFGVKDSDVIAFSRQLATLIERGINAFTALQLLRDQIHNTAFREVITTIIQDLQQGRSFADAIARHPQAFPPIYSQMVRVGEQTGNLHVVLKQTAGYMERENASLKKVGMALIYPAILLLIAAGVVTILITFTLPPLIEMFSEFDAELPLVTRILMSITGFFSSYILYLAAIVIGVVALAVWYIRRPTGRQKLDRLQLRIPLIGQIVSKREISHFSHTMSISLESGLPMIETMNLAIQTTRNSAVRQAIVGVRTRMLEGSSLFHSMATNALFPSLLVQMVKVGEEVGTLGTDLLTVADLYEQEVDEKVNMLLSMLQPCFLLIIGVIVAFIAVSVILPIYSLMGAI